MKLNERQLRKFSFEEIPLVQKYVAMVIIVSSTLIFLQALDCYMKVVGQPLLYRLRELTDMIASSDARSEVLPYKHA